MAARGPRHARMHACATSKNLPPRTRRRKKKASEEETKDNADLFKQKKTVEDKAFDLLYTLSRHKAFQFDWRIM